MYITHILYSSIDRHLGCLHISAIVSNAATDLVVHISLWDPDFISFGYIYPKWELLDNVVALFLIFWGISTLFTVVTLPVYIPGKNAERAPPPFPSASPTLTFFPFDVVIPTDVRWQSLWFWSSMIVLIRLVIPAECLGHITHRSLC